MQNLKKALSLVMVAAMLIGFGAIGGGAGALTSDFTDADKVTYSTAVDVMTELGVLTGYDNANGTRSFDPTKVITRAELAVLLCKVLNGGQAPVLDANAKADFADMPSPDYDWAHPYVAYCVANGLLSGDSGAGGNFRPGDPVTMIEAAKTMLCAIGYRADVEGFVGANWLSNVSVRANDCDPKLYNGIINPVVTEPLTREKAAQMMYNASQTGMKMYTTELSPTSSGGFTTVPKLNDFTHDVSGTNVSWTLLTRAFGVDRYTGVIIANDMAGLDGSFTRTGTTQVRIEYINGSATTTTQLFEVATPIDVIGYEVDIFAKLVNNRWTVYGNVIETENNQALVIPTGENITTYARNNGLTLPSNGELTTYVNFKTLTELNSLNYGSGRYYTDTLMTGSRTFTSSNGLYTYIFSTLRDARGEPANNTEMVSPYGIDIKLIDNDGDGAADLAIVIEPRLDIVTSLASSGNITLRGTSSTVNVADVVTDLTLARDDVVLVTEIEGKYYITEPETVEGTISTVSNNNRNVTVNGTSVAMSQVASQLSTSDYSIGRFYTTSNINFNDEYRFYLDTDGKIIAFEEIEGSAGQYILITEAGTSNAAIQSGADYQVYGYLADGTAGKVYTVNVETRNARAIVRNNYSSAVSTQFDWDVVFDGGNGSNIYLDVDNEPVIARYTMNSNGVLTLYDPVILNATGTTSTTDTTITAGTSRFRMNEASDPDNRNGVTNAMAYDWSGKTVANSEDISAYLNDKTVVFYVQAKYNSSGTLTKYEFSSARTGTKGIEKLEPSGTNEVKISAIVDGTTIKAMVIGTDKAVAASNRSFAFYSGNKDASNDYNNITLVTKDGLVTGKTEEDPGRGFYTYYTDSDGYIKFETIDDDDYEYVVNAKVTDFTNRTVTWANRDDVVSVQGAAALNRTGYPTYAPYDVDSARLDSSLTIYRVDNSGYLTDGVIQGVGDYLADIASFLVYKGEIIIAITNYKSTSSGTSASGGGSADEYDVTFTADAFSAIDNVTVAGKTVTVPSSTKTISVEDGKTVRITSDVMLYTDTGKSSTLNTSGMYLLTFTIDGDDVAITDVP